MYRIAGIVVGVSLLALPIGVVDAAEVAPRETPMAGQCWNVSRSAADVMSLDVPSVDCADVHTLETFLVAEWKARNPYQMTEDELWAAADDLCGYQRADTYLGVRPQHLPVPRTEWYFFFPTQQQWAAGERWIRCDVGLLQGWDALEPLRGSARELVANFGPRGVAWCTNGEPRTDAATAPVSCLSVARPWVWADWKFTPGKYPGPKKVKQTAIRFCQATAKKAGLPRNATWWYFFDPRKDWQTNQGGYSECFFDLSQTIWK